MSIREDIVNGLARALGVSELAKAKGASAPPPVATQNAGDLPASWLTSTYAPGWPIQPITRPDDVLLPREIDYPISVNATLQPRTAYGLMPFAALKEAYETVAEIRLPVSTLLREMTVFRPHLVDEDGGEILDHPYEWLVKSPDRVTSWDVWLTRFLKNSLIFDAAAFFYEYDKADLKGIRYVDGSTLFIMVDENGQVPPPNAAPSKDPEVMRKYQAKAEEWLRKGRALPKTTPAYAQVIKGTPFGWYDASQIWYKPRSRRFDAPYGETAIEQAWAWILICANVSGFELAHYREGNMPEGWYSTPADWSLERIAAFESAFNQRMSTGATERMRARFLPAGVEWHETKKAEFPQSLYNQAMEMISLFFGVPPSEYGRVPGAGLGGAGFENAMQSSLFRMGLFPLKVFIEGAMNEVLQRSGVDDAYFDMTFPSDEADPAKHKENIIELLSNGLITFNNALAELGQDRIEGGDVHVMIEYGAVTILEDVLGGRTPDPGVRGEKPTGSIPMNPQEQQNPDDASLTGEEGDGSSFDDSGNGNGKKPPKPRHPNNPSGFGADRKEEATKDDKKLAEKMLMTRSLNPDGKFYSLPKKISAVKVHGNDGGLRKLSNWWIVDKKVADDLRAAGATSEGGGEVLGIWRNKTTDEIYISVGDWVSDETMQAIRTVFKDDKFTIEDESCPTRSDNEWEPLRKQGVDIPHIPKHPHDAQHRFASKGKLSDDTVLAILKDAGFETADIDMAQCYDMVDNLFNMNVAEAEGDEGEDIEELEKGLQKQANNDGVMVALDVPESVAQDLQQATRDLLPDGVQLLPAGEMHITLFYPGAIQELGFDQPQLLDAVKAFAKAHAPLSGVIGGVARFNGDGGNENPLVALFDCFELPQFRQDLVEFLHSQGVHETFDETDPNHGFIPHITLAYIPVDASMKDEVKIDSIPITFNEITVVWGGQWHHIPLQAKVNVQKIQTGDLAKHCGVCPEDDDYYGAPVVRISDASLPHDMAGYELVYMQPEGMPPKIAYWKPYGSENDETSVILGGAQYPREEAAYLIDRSMDFHLIPVSYAVTLDDEPGAAVFYTNANTKQPIDGYDMTWIEKAAVLDFITGQLNRTGFFTHPDDMHRLILSDNGVSFPENPGLSSISPFVDTVQGKPLSDKTLRAVTLLFNDLATWNDINRLVGFEAAEQAYMRTNLLLRRGHIPLPGIEIEPFPRWVDEEVKAVPDHFFTEDELRAAALKKEEPKKR